MCYLVTPSVHRGLMRASDLQRTYYLFVDLRRKMLRNSVSSDDYLVPRDELFALYDEVETDAGKDHSNQRR